MPEYFYFPVRLLFRHTTILTDIFPYEKTVHLINETGKQYE